MGKKKLDFTDFFPKSIEIRNIEKEPDKITVHLKSYSKMQQCPLCQRECRFHHSTYRRKLQDLPILGNQVIIRLTAYRYTCDHTDCEQKVFCETIDGFCGSYKRMTARLEDFLLTLVLHTSCEGASRIAKMTGIQVSGDTLIRMLLEKAEQIPPIKTDTIGIDDWAYRKGQSYGTIIVDGHTHKVIDLLEGRDGKALKLWLEKNKQVKVVTRDRANAYAAAIQEILPDATQIADRFHLHQNLLEAIKKAAEQELPAKIKIISSAEKPSKVKKNITSPKNKEDKKNEMKK